MFRRKFNRRELIRLVLFAAFALVLSPMPALAGHRKVIKTYQAPTDWDVYWVDGGPPGAIQAFYYSVPSGSEYWSDETTVPWRYVDTNDNTNPTPGFWPNEDGRLGHLFYLDQDSWPWWDPNGNPRVEFDSAIGSVQNAELPDPGGWDGAGVIVPGMIQLFTWSMYLDPSFSSNQQWLNLLQFHPGGNYRLINGTVDDNYWVTLEADSDVIKFSAPGFNPDNPLWADSLATYLGTWVDFALYAEWSTGDDGVLEFYVNGERVARHRGSNFYSATNDFPYYYLKQGYYRSRNITTEDTVYQTPVLVTMPLR